jgi:hypothetical protein
MCAVPSLAVPVASQGTSGRTLRTRSRSRCSRSADAGRCPLRGAETFGGVSDVLALSPQDVWPVDQELPGRSAQLLSEWGDKRDGGDGDQSEPSAGHLAITRNEVLSLLALPQSTVIGFVGSGALRHADKFLGRNRSTGADQLSPLPLP